MKIKTMTQITVTEEIMNSEIGESEPRFSVFDVLLEGGSQSSQ